MRLDEPLASLKDAVRSWCGCSRQGLLPRARQRTWELPLQEIDEFLAHLASEVEGVAGGARACNHAQLERVRMRFGHLQLEILAVPKRRRLHDLSRLGADALDRRRVV